MRRIGGVLVLVALLAAGCTSNAAASGGTLVPESDRQAATMRGELLGGGTFDLGARTGQVVVVNFWGSWCSPCWAEADDLERTYQATKDSGVYFIGVNTRDTRDAAADFVRDKGVTYPTIFDHEGKVAIDFKISQPLPATILIDRRGRVAMVQYGAVLSDKLQPLVTQLAAEPS